MTSTRRRTCRGCARSCCASWPRYPLHAIAYRLVTSRRLHWIPQPRTDEEPIETYCAGIQNNVYKTRYGLKTTPWHTMLSDWLARLLETTTEPRWIWLVWRPALAFWAIVAAAGAVAIRRRDVRFLPPFLPAFLNTLSLFLAAQAQNQRYQYPVTLMAGFLVLLAFLPKAERPAEPPAPG
ncbi:MAG: hypothetical protein NTW86_10345 [Candidatus Sumerlaeota bacterium]|nr:hypothetical protein [Candidatus Sumerlaeota bacterium]